MTAASHALRRSGAVALASVLTGAVLVAAPAGVAAQTPEFSDLDGTTHAEAIRLVAEDGITRGYPDGTFRPRENVRRDQMATFLAAALRLDPRTPQFPDVPAEHVHADGIGAIAHADITRGFPDGTYRPLGEVTRGQMATFLAKGLDLPAGRASFSDVPDGYVHADAIAALADSGITEGFADGTFRPNLPVKRDQMAAFLARGIPLPREPECPGSRTATTSSQDGDAETSGEATTSSDDAATSSTERDSEDLVELEGAELQAAAEGDSAEAASSHDLGPAVPGTAFPLTSVLRTSDSTLEVHSQDLSRSRGARVEEDGAITATTTIPAGRRTWATAQIGDHVYAGQWPPGSGTANLFRYSTSSDGTGGTAEKPGDRTATAVAAVPTGGEFWTLTADRRGRLWAGTRAHASGEFRAEIGLGDGRSDGRHVVHRIDPAAGHRVTNVTFCLPDPPTTNGGVRPDIKQLAAVDDTLYVGTGQQSGGARVYAFEPGDRTDVPAGEVRDLTPSSVRGATGVFTLTVSDRYVALGTQAGGSDSARVVVLDRRTEQVRADVWLQGESRVDAIAVRDDRVVATGFSGSLYDVTIRGSDTVRAATKLPPPVEPAQFHRYVEITDEGHLRGVTGRGVVWRRATDEDVERVNLVDDTGAPVSPGQPHSLHVGASDIVVGASSAATLRDVAAPDGDSRTVTISGEAKAVTSDAVGTTYLATYPNAGLWRVEAGGDEAEQLRSWTADYRRPAAADHDDRTGRVNVIARNDNAPQSDPRNEPQANFQFRPSLLFSMDPNQTTRATGYALGRGGSHTSTVSAGTSARQPVEASALRNDDSLAGADVFVGDTFGGVQRVDTTNGARKWYRPPATGQGDRRVVDIELVDGVLVVVQTGALYPKGGGSTYLPMTVVRELDPATGAELSNHVVRTSSGAAFAVGDAVTSGSVTVMTTRNSLRYFDRSTQTYYGQGFDQKNDTFGGPYVDLDRASCQLYSFERKPSHLVRQPPPGVFEDAACPPLVDLPTDESS